MQLAFYVFLSLPVKHGSTLQIPGKSEPVGSKCHTTEQGSRARIEITRSPKKHSDGKTKGTLALRLKRESITKKQKEIIIEWNEPKDFKLRYGNQHDDLCKQRDNIREVLSCSNATPIKQEGLNYRCCFCDNQYVKPQELREHNLVTHGVNERSKFMQTAKSYTFLVKLDITDLACTICYDNIDSLDDLLRHLKNDHSRSIHLDIHNHIMPFKFPDEILKCALCLNEYQTFQQLQTHMHSHYRNFICGTCSSAFINQYLLKCHMQSHKEAKADPEFKCSLCPKAFPTLLSLNAHVKMSHSKQGDFNKHRDNIQEVLLCSNATPIKQGGISYKCCFCSNQYTNPQELKEHNLEEHGENERKKFMQNAQTCSFIVKLDITDLICKLCDNSIDSLEDLLNHLKEDHSRNIHLNINNHIMPFKLPDDKLKCAICQNEYQAFKQLQTHMHSHYRNFICETCSAAFINQTLFTSHVRTHKEAEAESVFKCSLCPKAFPTSLRLKNHVKSVHTKPKVICRYCNESFDTVRLRFKHMWEVHGVKVLERKCTMCDKSYFNSGELNNHIRQFHLMERTHECPHCDLKFFTPSKLNYHLVTHTGEKAFECTFCQKRYGRKKNLVEHIKIHMNDRRYECNHCDMKFVQKCSLKGHLRSKHGEEPK